MHPTTPRTYAGRTVAPKRILFLFGAILVLTAFLPAGGHQSPGWSTHYGSGSAVANGDYISASGGLNTYYSFWIEVPAGLGQMGIYIFDADTGTTNDFASGPYNTSTRYQVYDPSGTQQRTWTVGNDPAYDNAWYGWTFNNPTAGHWELRVDTSSAVTSGNDCNVFGVNAVDTTTYPLSLAYSWNLSTNPGWSTQGQWAWGTPTGGGGTIGGDNYGNPDPTSGYTGSYVYGYNLSGNYANNVPEYHLTTLAIDCSDLAETELRFRRWLNVEGSDYDHAYVRISTDNTNWNTVWQNGTSTITDSGWTQYTYDISSWADGRSTVYIRWTMGTTDVGWRYSGWNIDDIEIWGQATPPTELNVYAESFVNFGLFSPQTTRSFDLYPYVDCGCDADMNEFDSDSTGTYTLSSRTGGYSQSFPTVSGNNAWRNNVFSGWTTDFAADDYGIWPEGLTIDIPGGLSGNLVTHYLGDYGAAAPPPTAQPQSGSLRLYFPTDAGGAPEKPYVGQVVKFVSGQNPPQVGQLTRLRVRVDVTNPTPHAITFSASNTVNAFVPGGAVVYAGNDAVTQGSVTAEPAVGGSGTVTWNPGTLAAGTTASLDYEVNVTPTASGRLIITGTPAANGTTARYVDETGNTTQARATFTFGPLCELAVTTGTPVPTRVLLADFGGVWAGDAPVLRWSTAAEQGTVGFYVSRWDAADGGWRRLTDALLPALPGHPQGGVYRLPDPEADRAAIEHYLVEEVEADGTVHAYGPFAVDWAGPLPRDRAAAPVRFSRAAHPGRPASAIRPDAADDPPADDVSKAAATSAFKLAVPAADLYAVDLGAIAAGLPRQALRADRLALTSGGVPVATRPFPDGQGFYFFGDARHTLYADTDIYRFTPGKLTPILGPDDAAPVAPVADGTFAETLAVERDRLPAPAVTRNPESDYWFWDYLYAGDPALETKTFAVATPGAAGSGAAALTVRLHGGTDTGTFAEHQVAVRLNGVLLGDGSWSGRTARALHFTLDPALLRDGDNQVELTARRGDGVAYSLVYLDGFTVEYQRRCLAVANRLRLRGLDEDVITVAGFDRDDLAVLDVTDPAVPRLQPATVDFAAGSWRVSFRPERGRDYFAVAWSAATLLAKATADRPSDLRNAATAADYLVIAPRQLGTPAKQLAAYRATQGYRTLVVDIENIYDEFNHGRPSPHAVSNFLSYAATAWAVPPRFVVLAGRGTFDYRDLKGYGDNLLPPIYTGTPHGLAAADMRYGCIAGDDSVPDLAIGRLPAATAAELQAMVDKIIAYEAQPAGDWSRRALVVADDPDPAGDFPADSEDIAAGLPLDLAVERIYLSEQTPADARAALVDGITAGAGLVNYLGHGGVDRLAAEGLLRITDIPGLANGARLPLLLAFTCAVGECTIPGYPGLGEALLTQPDGGAIAVYAPAGLSDNAAAAALNAALAAELDRGHATLGDAIRAALAAWAPADPTAAYHRDLYILLGDPALLIKR